MKVTVKKTSLAFCLLCVVPLLPACSTNMQQFKYTVDLKMELPLIPLDKTKSDETSGCPKRVNGKYSYYYSINPTSASHYNLFDGGQVYKSEMGVLCEYTGALKGTPATCYADDDAKFFVVYIDISEVGVASIEKSSCIGKDGEKYSGSLINSLPLEITPKKMEISQPQSK